VLGREDEDDEEQEDDEEGEDVGEQGGR